MKITEEMARKALRVFAALRADPNHCMADQTNGEVAMHAALEAALAGAEGGWTDADYDAASEAYALHANNGEYRPLKAALDAVAPRAQPAREITAERVDCVYWLLRSRGLLVAALHSDIEWALREAFGDKS